MRNISLLRLAVIGAASGVVLGLGGVGWTEPVKASSETVVVEYPVVKTEDFESGNLKLSDVSDGALVRFLQDLNRRKDFDFSSHGGQPGPDAAYLWQWVQNVTGELQNRGYWMDSNQTLHHPNGTPVAMR